MPYTSQHKAEMRARIIESARLLFNRGGFSSVSIDHVMEGAGLTRGGFYNHFKDKSELYAEAVASSLNRWRNRAGISAESSGPEVVLAMIEGYLSSEHLYEIDLQCPMAALPSDVARSTPEAREAYQMLLENMISDFEGGLDQEAENNHEISLVLTALCVGGMILARTVNDSALSNDIRESVRKYTVSLAQQQIANG